MRPTAALILLATLAALFISKSGFAQWEDPPPRPVAVEKTPRVPYQAGAAVPPGFHVESKVRPGLVVTGAVMAGVAYSLGAMTLGASNCSQDRWLLVPGAGPFIALANDPYPSSGQCQDPEAIRQALRTASGLGQGIGGGLMLLGVLLSRQYLVPNEARANTQRRWAVVPAFGASSGGFSLVGSF